MSEIAPFMHGVILLGGPGAGKGTQAVMLAQALKLPHISTGDLFRLHRKNGTPLGQMANTFIANGLLVPDDVTISMVRERLAEDDCRHGFILDGFPRTIPQGDALDGLLADLNKSVTIVLYFRVRERVLLERLSHRWTCRDCAAVFPYESLPPREGCRQPACTGELFRRADDDPETQMRRIQVYATETAPLIGYYQKKGLLVEINGEHTIDYVHRVTLEKIHEGRDFYQ
jgi:adenylate kinase